STAGAASRPGNTPNAPACWRAPEPISTRRRCRPATMRWTRCCANASCRADALVSRRASLHRRERGRVQEPVVDPGDDGAVLRALRALGEPFRIARELGPLGLALGERLPGQEVVQVLVSAGPDHDRPESGLADAMAFPELERGGLEPLEQGRQPAGDAVIDAQLVDHGSPLLGMRKRPTLMAAQGKAIRHRPKLGACLHALSGRNYAFS